MRKLILLLSVLAVVSCKNAGDSGHAGLEEEPEARVLPDIGFFPEDYLSREGRIRQGDYFTKWMGSLGVSPDDASAFAADTLFDVRKLRAGNVYEAYYADSLSSDPSYVVYHIDKVSSIVYSLSDSLSVKRVDKSVEIRREAADVVISTSLWNDMASAGAPVSLISGLSDIYAWTVDFFSLQEGDCFRVLYDEAYCEGEHYRTDTIRYAEFIRDGKVLPAIMFDKKDGGNIYWGAEGESLRKAFLKAPLEFKRVSSGFSYARRHPVHGNVRPHTGVDYAAPTGTPVVSIGDGTVISKGWGGGGGNTVKIRHNATYTTAYLHLSRYASGLKAGDRVRQGQVIGYVGMTGTATGPHLDFRVWKNGTPIDPLKMESPPADPLPESDLDSLRTVASSCRIELYEMIGAPTE